MRNKFPTNELIGKLVDALIAVDRYIGNPTDGEFAVAKQALAAYDACIKQIENEMQTPNN